MDVVAKPAQIKFKKQYGTQDLYWFHSSRGICCLVTRQGKRWVAKGQAWYGPATCYGATRIEAARNLLYELA